MPSRLILLQRTRAITFKTVLAFALGWQDGFFMLKKSTTTNNPSDFLFLLLKMALGWSGPVVLVHFRSRIAGCFLRLKIALSFDLSFKCRVRNTEKP